MRSKNLIALLTAFIIMIPSGVLGDSRRSRELEKQKEKASAWGDVSAGFQLMAHADKEQVNRGDAISIKITIKNSSREVLRLIETSAEKDYRIDIENQYGQQISLTEYGRHIRKLANEGTDFRLVGVKLKPGEKRENVVDVSKLYDLTVPGTYRITVKRTVQAKGREGTAEVVSNKIEINTI